jgi:hypothetical protein
MKRFVRAPLLGTALLAFAALEPSAYAQDMRLIGSGASFPAPIYLQQGIERHRRLSIQR